MGIPWDGMGWDRHDLLWDGMGWDRKICPIDKPANIVPGFCFQTAFQELNLCAIQ